MESQQAVQRLHPLVATAAVTVTLASLLGAAAIAGLLPNSHGTPAPLAADMTAAPVVANAAAPASVAPAVEHRTIVHHRYVTHTQPVAARADDRSYAPAPVYAPSAPVAQSGGQMHPVGIGVGAVLGGLVGSHVGGGNGRTLATIAGAVGGGYLGNEVAKRNP